MSITFGGTVPFVLYVAGARALRYSQVADAVVGSPQPTSFTSVPVSIRGIIRHMQRPDATVGVAARRAAGAIGSGPCSRFVPSWANRRRSRASHLVGT
jgi:hypothetical protein